MYFSYTLYFSVEARAEKLRFDPLVHITSLEPSPHVRGQVRHCKNQHCGSDVCRDSRMILLQLTNPPSIFYLSERSCRKVDWLSLGELGFVFHSVFCSEQMYSYMYIQFRS